MYPTYDFYIEIILFRESGNIDFIDVLFTKTACQGGCRELRERAECEVFLQKE